MRSMKLNEIVMAILNAFCQYVNLVLKVWLYHFFHLAHSYLGFAKASISFHFLLEFSTSLPGTFSMPAAFLKLKKNELR